MGLPEETEAKLLKQHQELCKTLNLDKVTSNETWKSFKKVYDTIVLEGDPLHWLGCALYVSCKSSTTPSVSKSHLVIQGNQVSLDRLLTAVGLSIVEFFKKIRKWVSVQDLQPDLEVNITKLEHVFNVSMVLYQKFQPIFYDMFNNVSGEQVKTHKSKKVRQPLPSIHKIFDFTWSLFLCVKSNFPNIVDDLVNLYPLMLASCDFIYANAVISGRKDLIKNSFSVSPKSKYNVNDIPCIVDDLCQIHDGIPIQVKSVKEYYWRKQIKVLFERNILKGYPELFSNVLDINNFDQNFKNVNKNYDEFVLSSGCIDERIFLTGLGKDSETEDDSKSDPLSVPKDFEEISLKSGPNLKNILSSRSSGPGEYLKQLKCTSKMEETISNLSEKLLKQLEDSPKKKETVLLVNKMFYKLLDSILSEEIKKAEFDPEKLLTQEIVVKTLFACAFEIISYSSNLDNNFPWILDTLGVNSFHFYRIIEVVVRNEDSLKRDIVKHLRVIEESILESLAWRRDSPLWTNLIESNQPIPSSEDVIADVREELENGTEDVFAGKTNLIQSPGAPLADKFLSPRKRQLPPSETEPAVKYQKTEGERKKPKRTGSVPLFFRKFYYLASVRLKDMCNQLRLLDSDLRTKIWTCFEKTIVQNVSLMLDRHLDQMLMCSIYVMCKIVSHELTFMDMMKCYRNQPQAQSHVYRNVLIKPYKTLDDLKNDTKSDEKEEKGDIIKFYNEVYIQRVKDFTKKFRNKDNEKFVLSPIPTKKATPVNGPKRISDSLPIYVSGFKKYMSPNSNTINYYFARSPAKDLKAINMMVSHEMIPKIGKQLLKDNSSGPLTGTLMTRKVKDLYAERMTIKSQEISNVSNPL